MFVNSASGVVLRVAGGACIHGSSSTRTWKRLLCILRFFTCLLVYISDQLHNSSARLKRSLQAALLFRISSRCCEATIEINVAPVQTRVGTSWTFPIIPLGTRRPGTTWRFKSVHHQFCYFNVVSALLPVHISFERHPWATEATSYDHTNVLHGRRSLSLQGCNTIQKSIRKRGTMMWSDDSPRNKWGEVPIERRVGGPGFHCGSSVWG